MSKKVADLTLHELTEIGREAAVEAVRALEERGLLLRVSPRRDGIRRDAQGARVERVGPLGRVG